MKKTNLFLKFAALSFCLNFTHAQVKIGDNPTTIQINSALEIESTNKGVLFPRVELSGTNDFSPLTQHVKGMIVYNLANTGTSPINVTEGYYYNDGSRWVKMTTNKDTWSIEGNAGTNAFSNFIGTTDNNPLTFKTNNIQRMVLGIDQSTSMTNLSLSSNSNSTYTGNLTSVNNVFDAQNGTQAGSLFGFENLLYLRSGSSLNSSNGIMRGIRNRLWNVQTSNYPNVQGVFNDYRGEVTDILDYKGFANYMDLRSDSRMTNFYGFINEFNQFNGLITNFYGYSNYPRQSNLDNYSNYYGYFQSNLDNNVNRYAFYYDATGFGTAKVVINGQGRIGIGTTIPQAAIEIDSANPLKMNNVSTGDMTDKMLTINDTGEVRKVAIPNNATFQIANLTLPSGNGIVRHNYDIGLAGINNNSIFFKITGTTQQFSITGISGGTNGRMIKLYNSANTGNMILTDEDSNSLPFNRIKSLSGGNVNTNNDGIITLLYDGSISRWIVVDVLQ